MSDEESDLEERVTEGDGRFVFHKADGQERSSPASITNASFTLLCMAVLSFGLLQQERKKSILFCVLLVVCYSLALSLTGPTYRVRSLTFMRPYLTSDQGCGAHPCWSPEPAERDHNPQRWWFLRVFC